MILFVIDNGGHLEFLKLRMDILLISAGYSI